MGCDVLVVDDSAAIRKILQRVLRQTGMAIRAIHEAGDGEEALSMMGQHSVNLVLSDINMPKMDGLEFTRQVRALPQYRFVPIVLLTSESNPEKKQQGKAAGATAWIVKPFDPDQLLAVVKKVMR